MSDSNRQWLLASRPTGMVTETNFEFCESPIPEPGEGEVLIRNLYISFDPAMRGWMEDRESYLPPVAIGEPMRAGCVGQVLESKNPDFQPGDLVQGMFGWQEYAIGQAGGLASPSRVPSDIPMTLPLGPVGITGFTAYFGPSRSRAAQGRRDRGRFRRRGRDRLSGCPDRAYPGMSHRGHRGRC